jgi:predicted house-cleaning noncanonical NTP pyrophosphatase (MazG superfamily)
VIKIKKIYYNKLVRDKIPEVIKKSGGVAEFTKLSSKEFKKELLLKVGEEASGLPNAKDRADLIKELADIEAVTDEIKKVYGITDEELMAAKKANFGKKGGFDKKLFLVWSENTGYKTNERRNK